MSTMVKENKIKDVTPLPSVGSIVEGKVVARDRSSLFVDLGPQGTGIIYGKEFYESKDTIKNLNIGDKVFAKIVELENEDGYKELSLQGATKEISWQKLRELKEKGEILNVKITGVNKGGLLTNIEGIAAFLPVSQLSPENYPRVIDADKQKILKELQKFIGKTLEVKVLDLMAQENKLILSEKAKAEDKIKEVLKNYKKGDIVEGKITGIADFGAFIKFPLPSQILAGKNLEDHTNKDTEKSVEEKEQEQTKTWEGEIEGLIHISELDWQLVQNPAEVVKVGEVVKAQIIDINNNQVFLSLKSLKENPWEKIEKEYKRGDTIKGKVVSLTPFGAFVEVAPKIRGLCHISELSSSRSLRSNRESSISSGQSDQGSSMESGQKQVEESLKIGETYDFEVLLIEPKEHRMSLKLVKKDA